MRQVTTCLILVYSCLFLSILVALYMESRQQVQLKSEEEEKKCKNGRASFVFPAGFGIHSASMIWT